MSQQPYIPIHKLQDRAPEGIEIRYIDALMTSEDTRKLGIHRDDHYIFMILEEGDVDLMIDFQVFPLRPSSIMVIQPGQVHAYKSGVPLRGWFVAMDALMMGEMVKKSLEENIIEPQPRQVSGAVLQELIEIARILYHHSQQESYLFQATVIHSLAAAFVSLFTASYVAVASAGPENLSRASWITRQFRALVTRYFRTEKSPSAYAQRLHYSLPHLNESVKQVTGFTVSYWIQYETMLEARRMLYFTDLDVKEIAAELGYEDPAYFTRLFNKSVGQTPLQFRKGAKVH